MIVNKFTNSRTASAAIEFVVLLPLLCLLFLITIDAARVFYYAIIIENCARNGAVYGAQVFDNQGQQWNPCQPQYGEGQSNQTISTELGATQMDGSNLNPALSSSNVTINGGTITIKYTFTPLVTSYPGIGTSIVLTRTIQTGVAPASPSN